MYSGGFDRDLRSKSRRGRKPHRARATESWPFWHSMQHGVETEPAAHYV